MAALRAELDSREVEILTPAPAEEVVYEAGPTTGTADALTLFMNRAGRYQLLTAAEEVALAKRIERGDAEAKERMINSNLRLVVSIAKRYQGHGLTPARPGPGRRDRPEPRGREVRLAAWVQVLDLRDLVDPSGLPARGLEPVHRRSASPCTCTSGA